MDLIKILGLRPADRAKPTDEHLRLGGELICGRRRNFWEPIFDPNLRSAYPARNWEFDGNSGPSQAMLSAENFPYSLDLSDRTLIFEKTFNHCDFNGSFNLGKILFKGCIFRSCDFGIGTWSDVKFTGCQFERCSFSLATFNSCEFRDCKWDKIGMSSNELRFHNTIITKPATFVNSAYTNLDEEVLRHNKVKPSYQRMRLERTKASVARAILESIRVVGDDDAYYEAARFSTNQSITARKAQADYDIRQCRWPSWPRHVLVIIRCYIDSIIYNLYGGLNAWGASLAYPTLLGIGLFLIFAAIYKFLGVEVTWPAAIIRSLDVGLLVGYDKQVQDNHPVIDQGVTLLHVGFSIAWYTVFLATAVNRVSRIR